VVTVKAAPAPATAAPIPPTLVAPSNLVSQCSAAGDAFTVSWSPVSGADSYYLRVDYLANNAAGSWFITDGVDYNLDADLNTTFTGIATAGQPYSWWVHGAAAGVIGPSASGTFTCTAATANTAPAVNAGPDQVISLPSTATLSGTATDDGKPSGTLTSSW